MKKNFKIIVVDDAPTNLTALTNILKPHYEVYPVSSATKMFDLLEMTGADLILLDVQMPDLDGYDAARLLKSSVVYKEIPIIFMTELFTINEMEGLELGAVDYIYKPIVAPLLLQRVEMHCSLLNQQKELQSLNSLIQNKLIVKIGEAFDLQTSILGIAAGMVERRDEKTGGHINRIQSYLKSLIDEIEKTDTKYSEEISSWNRDFLFPASQLYDLGKFAISGSILNKPGRLTDEEFEIMKTHTKEGVDAISRMEYNELYSSFLDHAKLFAGTHHERWDGSGYPYGLSDEEIPLEGRLMAVADVYDALVSSRPYKDPFPPDQAVELIKYNMGAQFDPGLEEIFDAVSGDFAAIAKA